MQRRDKETRIKMPAAGEPEGVRLGAHLNIGFTNKLKLECASNRVVKDTPRPCGRDCKGSRVGEVRNLGPLVG
jgi:hypothetical protein